MTVLGAIQISLCGISLAAAAILAPIVQYQIYRHLRRRHREAFDRLAISNPSFLWREDREAEDAAYAQFLPSVKHATLKDPELLELQRRESLIWRACGVSFVVLVITFLVFRADSQHVWDFLVDLSRY